MRTNTTFYRIPDKYFPTVNVITPFHAKVTLSGNGADVKIEDVCLSPKCRKYINNTAGMITEMEEVIKTGNTHVHPTVLAAISPHIYY